MKYCRRVHIEVNLKKIKNNLERIMERLPEGVKLCTVIKADGYGHGAEAIAEYLKDYSDFFAVATTPEAIQLRKKGIRNPILILGYTWEEDYEELIENEVRLTIFREEDAQALSRMAEKLHKKAYIHIKLDTGMHRIGFPITEEAEEAVLRISRLPGIETEGIFTHFAKADERDKTSAHKQLELYKKFTADLEKKGLRIPIYHTANSAAAMEMPEAAMDMVRSGISTYGLYPSDEVSKEILLEPALSLKSTVVYVKDLEAGEGVSYGYAYVAPERRRIATIPIGYADGYPRLLSGKGYVLIRGKKAPVLGRICMDQMMVDVTDIPDAQAGDTVTLIGQDGDACIRVEDLSALCGIFNYEFVCGLEKRIPRVYMEE